jgi:preprotein translocase subunit SecA
MGPIYTLLGLTVGVLQEAARTDNARKAFVYDADRSSPQEDVHQLRLVDRREAYAADITYGTNHEFGFDYLRDNLALRREERVQRVRNFAIVDEVDNILIDEARTPLIISGPAAEDAQEYLRMSQVVRQLRPEDYEIDERDRTVVLTEAGESRVEEILGLALSDPALPVLERCFARTFNIICNTYYVKQDWVYTKGSDFMAECKAHLFFMSKSERRRIAKAKGRARARKRAARQGN